MIEVETDVLIVGFGAAGTSAAIAAHDAGARVTVLEKAPVEHAGGNARVSGQAWFCPTDAEMARTHLHAMAGPYPVAGDVVNALASEAAANNDWVTERIREVRGVVRRDPDDPLAPDEGEVVRIPYAAASAAAGLSDIEPHELWDIDGVECGTDRNMIGGVFGFTRLWFTLLSNVDKRGIDVRYGTAATSLVRDSDGAVTGVEAEGADGEKTLFHVKRGVILATGGFAGSAELTRTFLRLPDAVPQGSPYNTGDGMRLGQRIGAELAHPGNYMAISGVRFGDRRIGDNGEVRDHRYIHVGKDGRRFIDETSPSLHGKARLRGTFDYYPGFPHWTIFDEEGRRAGPIVVPRDQFAIGWAKQVERYSWSLDNSEEIDKGWIVRADTLPELAERLGLDPDGLVAEVERYNADVASGSDTRFDRPSATLRPITRPPFYGYAWAQLLISTLGGLAKDADARVLDVDGAAIPGLYAAGEVASTFSWLISGGMSLGDCLAFGRIAGRSAAEDARR